MRFLSSLAGQKTRPPRKKEEKEVGKIKRKEKNPKPEIVFYWFSKFMLCSFQEFKLALPICFDFCIYSCLVWESKPRRELKLVECGHLDTFLNVKPCCFNI